jgi:hypothetical protein
MPVGGDYQDYLCEIVEWHPGPCASASVPRSVQARDRWEAEHPGWEKHSTMADPYQGET